MIAHLSPARRWFCNLPPVLWVWSALYQRGWPGYDCIDCIGAGCGYYNPCYCQYHNCVGPCEEPTEFHAWVRWLHGFLFTTSSPFWRDLERP